MRVAQTKVYTFDELSQDAKQKALEDNAYINVEHDWYDYLLEEWRAKLEASGFTEADIQFSGFYSQGDGASFTASVDLVEWLKSRKLANKYRALYEQAKLGYITASIDRVSSLYVHENTIKADIDTHYIDVDYDTDRKRYDLIEKQAEEVENILQEDARDVSKIIYRELENEYDYLTSEEAIKETILANEYEFTEGGKLW